MELKSWLETAQANNILLAGRMGALMVRMSDIKDAVMSDAKGEPSDSSSDVDLWRMSWRSLCWLLW